ncbi:Glycoside hydrolase family 35 [Penicillium riverlandense]|uniref:Glycoside hydrolase family 35 n=1 Tax=Penicillium riverlandense TaxID=1903569 RepID=UPI0025477220|nr:Glycoside hydrolase family 35 [Penicillium riverlandense]KAJ5818332.1 Glycoside hydrolase family 35 [Penicillium riverlandense]
MRIFSIVPLLFVAFLSGLGLVAATNDGNTTAVTWDPYSLSVNGERVYIFSGEFHYMRLPVPEMWLDVFQKLRANGFNAVSIYFFWSYHSASEGTFDFETGAHDIQRVFDYAKQAGLYVIARAGPYCNGETSAGGFALWAANGQMGKERTSAESYYSLWQPWILNVGRIIARNQVTNGGPVILVQHENELQETDHSPTNTLVEYMEQITAVFDEAGVIVPSTHNEKGMRSESWSTDYEDVGGAVNVYGLDSYPGGLSCTNPDSGFNLVRTYYQWFQNYSYTQPGFLPEFEGGWFQPWGGYFYDQCAAEQSPEFADVYYKNNVGSRVTLQSLYMAFGGTNWGYSATPVVYTSYDYDAPLRETREIRDKLKQTKLLGLFTRVSSGLLHTEMEGNGTGYTDDSSIYTWALRNPSTNAGFYVLAHDSSPSRDVTDFSLNVNTSAGALTIPDIQLDGRQSKIIVTDYQIGTQSSLLYSSAEVLTYATLDADVIVFYLNIGQKGHFAFKDAPAHLTYQTYGNSQVSSAKANYGAQYSYIQGQGATVIKFSNDVLIYLLDKETAWNFFAVPTTSNPNVAPSEQILALGPYLVREATVSRDTVSLVGDNANTTSLEVYVGSSKVRKIKWNGKEIQTKRTAYGSLIGTAQGAENTKISLPALGPWKAQDTIPEIQPDYDDSRWTVCNKSSTVNAVAPLSLPVLYSGDYGYHAGTKLYRGRFDGHTATSANITVQSGAGAGWAAWLNGAYVGGALGSPSLAATSALLPFNGSTLRDTDNILTILMDYTGHDEDNVKPAGTQNPRGILGATLSDGNFTSWRIQGNAGGEANIDPVRGPMNEGALYGERMGWHLPGYKAPGSSPTSSPLEGVAGGAGAFYTTTFRLDLADDLDVPIGLQLGAPNGTAAVVQVFMNGYMFAHYLPHLGPQTLFPFPPGVINNRGENALALSMWALTDQGASLDQVELVAYGVYRTGFEFSRDWSYLQPRWKDNRSQYATEHEMATRKRRSENESNNSAEPSAPQTQSPADAQEHLLLIPGCRRALISLTGKGFERALLWKLDWYNYVKVITLAATGYRDTAIKLVGEQVMRPRGLTGLAQDTLEASAAELRSVFELLASEQTYPVLVHCTQGKDRTGLVVLLMLLLVGESVSPAAMADDYTRSEPELVSEFDERIREIRALGLDAEYTRCPPGFVEATTKYLDLRYGGVRRYLTGIGIDADMQGRIRRKLIFGGI